MSDPTARLNVSRDGDRIVVAGDIDAHTCPDLAGELDPLPGSGDVRIDVADVGFMDSSGLRVIISAHQLAESSGRKLLIERPSKSVSRILEISGLADHLHIVDAS
ncbi:MAG: STAS domain-containing protein [Ilumatobacter sp.]|uniref:STAS domain-containing protein n=1 Tax=Ilumatobacter sp. TaxID=1967498 RepID=UPI003C73B5D3